MKRRAVSTRLLLITADSLLICLLAGGIMYLWFHEKKEIEALETKNWKINSFC